jgi:EmrB/QacA subfamily drug resistance transporter
MNTSSPALVIARQPEEPLGRPRGAWRAAAPRRPSGTVTRLRPQATAVFAVTALGSFMAALDLSIVNVAFPALEASYPTASQAALAWVITAYSIVFGALLVAGGRTGDRLGRRRTFLGGIGLFLAGSLLCGIAPNVPFLVVSRVLQGVGAAFLLPASIALLIAAYPPERRTQMVALWGGIGALAVATGPSLGAAIVSAGGWRWAFLVNLPVGVGVVLVGRRTLVESEVDDTAARPDYLGVALISLALAALVLAVSEGTTWGWSDGRVVGALVVAGGLGAWFIRRCLHHPQPVVDLSLFSSRSFAAANAATLVYAAGFFPMLLGNILFLTRVWDYSIMRAGLAVTPGPLIVAVVAGPAGKLAGRIGFRLIVLSGGACFALGLVWYVLQVEASPAYLAHWLPGTLMIGLGIGLTFPVLGAAAVSALPPHRFAVGSAVNQTARQLGGALGIAVLVMLLGEPHGPVGAVERFHHLWAYSATAALVSGIIGSLIPRPSATVSSRTHELAPGLVAVDADLPLVVNGDSSGFTTPRGLDEDPATPRLRKTLTPTPLDPGKKGRR